MKKIIIIGGGVAGLSAGTLAQESGFETEIYEKHSLPGGLCTSWERKSYRFDGCIRYVYGSAEGQFCHSLMKKIGAGSLQFVNHDESIRVESAAGETVVFYCDLDRLQEHLLKIAPEDDKAIKALIRTAKSLSRTSMPTTSIESLADLKESGVIICHSGIIATITLWLRRGKAYWPLYWKPTIKHGRSFIPKRRDTWRKSKARPCRSSGA